jgi:hypothetical protein
VPASFEGYARHAGGALGGALVGLAIGAGLDPILAAHHWPLISQQLTDTLTGLGGGIGGHALAMQTRAARAFLVENQKAADLQRQITGLSVQIDTIPHIADRTRLRGILDRRVADWRSGAIKTSTFESAFKDIRNDYLEATGSGRRRRASKS